MNKQELKHILDEAYDNLNAKAFMSVDPVSIPHGYNKKRDVEISGFLTALISWGRRDLIVRSATKLMKAMNDKPYEFVMEADEKRLESLDYFVYRTMKAKDMKFMIMALRNLYESHPDMESIFSNAQDITSGISDLRRELLKGGHDKQTEKHLSDPEKNSACKRLFMFIRWMVRKDKHGIDFGLWESIRPAGLIIPLDVHTGNTARKLGLTARKTNDLKTAMEITQKLRSLDMEDPVKYDYSLFNLDL